jgi:hypothetical protein
LLEADGQPIPENDDHIIIYKEREEKDLKTIDAVFNYTMYYIGRYLTQDERVLLRENIIIFSFDKEEELHPVIENKFVISTSMTSPICATPSATTPSLRRTSIR